MSVVTMNGTLEVEILSDTFPIEGSCTPELRRIVESERQVSVNDVQASFMDFLVRYEDYPHPEDGSHREKTIDPRKITIRREGDAVVFDAVAKIGIQDKEKPYYYHDGGDAVIATASVPVRAVMAIVREYVRFRKDSGELLQAFAAAGDLIGIEKIDKQRKQLHSDTGEALKKAMQDGPIVIAHDLLHGYAELRYLVTALITHLMPARAFEDLDFMAKNVKPKFDTRRFTRDEVLAYFQPDLE